MSSHGDKCICVVCTCGRHKLCKPVHLAEGKIETLTEYNHHFLNFPMTVTRGKPAPQELSVGGEFYGFTESREKFIGHALGPRYQIVKPEYVPNKAKLESATTQRDNYQPWPGVVPPKRRQQAQYKPSSGTFDGTTTTKHDYVEMELPPHFVRQQQPFVKTLDKMDGISTQKEDYKKWSIVNVPSRRTTTLASPKQDEDRDFQSTSTISYIGHKLNRELVRAPQTLTTDHSVKFEGASTAKAAYLAWQLPPRYQRHRAQYNPSTAEFDATTTYKNTFIPKTACIDSFYIARYIHPIPTYAPSGTKFEGKSTNKTDYLFPNKVDRVVDFAPRNTYAPKGDDRDFISTTRGQHDPKPLPKCLASEWMSKERECDKDGHVHLRNAAVVV